MEVHSSNNLICPVWRFTIVLTRKNQDPETNRHMSTQTDPHPAPADKPAPAGACENSRKIRRHAGIGLIALSVIVVFATAYLMWVKVAFPADTLRHVQRIRPYWMFAGLVVMLACNMFLAGVFLLQSSRGSGACTGKTRSLAPVLYLTGSVNIGLLAAFLEITRFQPTALLALFICVPTMILRMFAGPMTSIISNPVIAYAVTILFYVVFYVCFFYPLYKRQYAAMGIFVAIILGIGFLIFVVAAALTSME